jgi:hypothetical protein
MSSTMNPDHSIVVRKKKTAVKNQVWCEGKRYRKHLQPVSLSFVRVETDNHSPSRVFQQKLPVGSMT